MFKKSIFHFLTVLLFLIQVSFAAEGNYAIEVRKKLSNPLIHQKLVNQTNYKLLNQLSRNYPKQNTLNVGWLSIFRRYNSGETVQNRTALNTHISDKNFIFDMDGAQLLDWSKITLNSKNEANFSEGQYVLSLNVENIENEDSPVILILLSNQHVVNDYLSNPASKMLANLGYTVAVLEYPNYGASLGRASLQSWLSATRGATTFLNSLTQKKVFILGHSVGGPLAFQSASAESVKNMVQGVASYGGFSDLLEMSKDQQSNAFIKFLSKPITFLTSKDNLINGKSSIITLAKNQIPTLVMHGAFDGAVTSRHLTLYQNEMEKIRSMNSNEQLASMETHLFKNLYHEEVNNYSEAMPGDFFQVWDQMGSFIMRTSTFKVFLRP